ncbi:MAG: tetratricopeptide repeat protein, partial [Bdellovibrionaceae bacterium]|nr:tetratricopeptide repeat protein [Pseudobdellovibrionaceae bacterium]
IESLQNIIAKKKGTPQEPELHYRLAELYMRRAKSGRFFELAIDPKTRELSSFPIPSETGAQWVRKALEEYSLIEKKWPNFSEMDGVLFNCAFAWQQLGHLNNAKEKYETLTRKYPRSSFIPDAWMALGEIHYQQRKFSQALEALNQLEAHKESRVYTYSLYKAAWAHYNLKQTEQSIEKLKKVLALNPPDSEENNLRSRQNLRREALRDLALFVSDITKPEKIYEFFEPLTTREELGQAILNTAKLYKTHGRQKDLLYILSEFSKLDPLHQAVVDSYVLSAETSEEMKDRNQVIEQYNLAAQFCQPGSDWRKMHTIEIQDAACREGFFKSAQAMAAKWWGIWEKNKNHREFSQLTEKMLRLILSAEDRQDPQYKTRFALAELLFNTENYLNASREYERVGKESKDENLRHDANYASILALDKAIEKDPSLKITSEQKRLARSYLDAHPKGEHAESVALKLAVLEYNDGNFVESLKLATPLSKSSHPRYKTGAEDLILEDLARKKDYTNIEKFTSSILSSSPPQERVKKITEIREQAAFAKIISEEKLPLQEKARLLEEYASKFPQSPLAPDAVAEALSLQLSLGHLPAAHRLAKKLWTDWPTDKRADKAREESATLLALLGQMKDAAILLEQISFQSDLEKLELAADFYLLENDYGKARSIYTK